MEIWLSLVFYATIASVPVPLLGQPNISISFGRVCASERITLYCVGEEAIEWTGTQVIGLGSISFRLEANTPGQTESRGNATAAFVNVTNRTINSSLTYNANDGVIIICADGNGESSKYVHPLYQRPGLLSPSFDDQGDRYTLSWDKPMNSEEYIFRNYIITIRRSDSDTPQTITIEDEDTTFVNGAFDRGTNYSFALVTTSSCEQSESVPFRIGASEVEPPQGLAPQADLSLGAMIGIGVGVGVPAALVVMLVIVVVILVLRKKSSQKSKEKDKDVSRKRGGPIVEKGKGVSQSLKKEEEKLEMKELIPEEKANGNHIESDGSIPDDPVASLSMRLDDSEETNYERLQGIISEISEGIFGFFRDKGLLKEEYERLLIKKKS